MKFSPILFIAALATAAPTVEPRQSSDSINKLIINKGKKYYGTITDPNQINNQQNVAVIKADFGQVTPENSMKWDATEPNRGQFNLGGADRVAQFAQQNGLKVRGHTLLWHSQLPQWVQNIGDRNQLTQVIENHIKTIVGRYKGQIYAWVSQRNSLHPDISENLCVK